MACAGTGDDARGILEELIISLSLGPVTSDQS